MAPSAMRSRVSWCTNACGKPPVAVAPGERSVYVAASAEVSITVGAPPSQVRPAAGRLAGPRRWLPVAQSRARAARSSTVAPGGTVVWGGRPPRLAARAAGGSWSGASPGGRLLHRYKTPDWQCGRAEADPATSRSRTGPGRSWPASATGAAATPHRGRLGPRVRDGRTPDAGGRDIEPPARDARRLVRHARPASRSGGLGNMYVSGWAATERITARGGRPRHPDPGEGHLRRRRAVVTPRATCGCSSSGDRLASPSAATASSWPPGSAGAGCTGARARTRSAGSAASTPGGAFRWGTRFENETHAEAPSPSAW